MGWLHHQRPALAPGNSGDVAFDANDEEAKVWGVPTSVHSCHQLPLPSMFSSWIWILDCDFAAILPRGIACLL